MFKENYQIEKPAMVIQKSKHLASRCSNFKIWKLIKIIQNTNFPIAFIWMVIKVKAILIALVEPNRISELYLLRKMSIWQYITKKVTLLPGPKICPRMRRKKRTYKKETTTFSMLIKNSSKSTSHFELAARGRSRRNRQLIIWKQL